MHNAHHQDEVPLDVRMQGLILKNLEKAQDEKLLANGLQQPPAGAAQNFNMPTQSIPVQKPRQKRPNQAQRRQMSSQFTIPIDHRAAQSQQARPQGNFPAQNYRQNYHHQNQRSPFQPTNLNDGFAKGGSQPLPVRHHPSPSYPGISPSSVPYDGRQPGETPNFFAGDRRSARVSHATRNSTGQTRSLYNPSPYSPRAENIEPQVALLEQLSAEILASAEIDHAQIQDKESFRLLIEDACRVHIAKHEIEVNGRRDFPPLSVQLRCFGSLASGFATKSSDMDLGLLSPYSLPQPDTPESQIPRIVEKTLLDMGFGARLLSKTRVPIIKVCEKPPQKLFADLLEERGKWERGEEDQDLEDDDGGNGHVSTPVDNEAPAILDSAEDAGRKGSGNKAQKTTDGDASTAQYHELLGELRQGSKSLSTYYGAAKKLLRKLGGRDITNSTAANFSVNDYQILDDLCAAFVRGLSDHNLKTRLQAYGSLSFDSNAPVATRRSIYGVVAQVEGEKMIMAWENRSIHEKDDHAENQARNRIDQWKKLQDKPTFAVDPLTYNRELQVANDALRRIPSVGVLLLEQNQYESASSYHSRAIRLLIELGAHDNPSSQSPVLPVVVQQYARGVHDSDTRSRVADFLRSVSSPSLRAVARRHKTLQLAREFEKAIERNLYPTETVDAIQQYVKVLREPLVPTTSGDSHFDFMIPMTPESWMLVTKIRDIQDPSHMSPNQPRDPYRDRLEFPKSDIGVQCDINFSAQLGLQNTHLLRCYSLTDPRVRPLVLFVKHWAKVRGINTPYRGTLSSYGYVLMVLHYLINVARPFVCPNLQLLAPPEPPNLTPEKIEATVQCKGRNVRFWRDADQIAKAAQQGAINQNQDSIGFLLRGFFEYYAQNNMLSAGHMRGFDWGRDVISIRTHGGVLPKYQKGWTGAKTVFEVRGPSAAESAMHQASPVAVPAQLLNSQAAATLQPLPSPDATTASKSHQERAKPEVKEVRHRYLFAIEDPFELDHNVARTVTHNGIVSIRDEFRRAWRIIRNAGKGQQQEDLLQDVSQEEQNDSRSSFMDLLDEIHGKPPV